MSFENSVSMFACTFDMCIKLLLTYLLTNVAVGLASHWPCFTDFSGLFIDGGFRAKERRWAFCLHSYGVWHSTFLVLGGIFGRPYYRSRLWYTGSSVLSVDRLSVCNVLYCGETVRPS